jgi:hypothetical protein
MVICLLGPFFLSDSLRQLFSLQHLLIVVDMLLL